MPRTRSSLYSGDLGLFTRLIRSLGKNGKKVSVMNFHETCSIDAYDSVCCKNMKCFQLGKT